MGWLGRFSHPFVVMLVVVVAESCSKAPPIVSIPDEKRVKLAVALEDPANSADLPGLNRLLSEEFRQQFIYVGTVPAGRSLFDEGESELRLAANPFVDANGAEGAIQVTAIIEWYYYGPTEAATKLLTGYAIGGLLGASLMGPGENAFTGAMQLRVQTSPPMTHAILVRVARDSDATKASRAEVLEAVAADAARYLLFRLGEALGSEGKVPFRAEAFAGSEAELVANWRVPSTGKLLN